MRFVAAWRFLTIIPLPFIRETSGHDLSRSLIYFPVVGLVIGMVLIGLSFLCQIFFAKPIISVLLTLIWLAITGAMHLDGLADTCDGLGGHTVTERLEIMKDSHHGTFGIAGIVCAVILRVFAISSLSQDWLTSALVMAPVTGRWAMVLAITTFPYARPSGLGKIFQHEKTISNLIAASLIVLVTSFLLPIWSGLLIILIAGLFTFFMGRFFQCQFGGLTGDNYGAINEVIEIVVLLLAGLFQKTGWLLI